MKERFIQNFNIRDLLAGVIVALVSIPISMGYSQLAGLPMIYGLYGSLFPILVFGLFTSSKNYVFGVDAAPAALVGGILAKLSVENSSAAAMEIVPMITLMTACWLIILYILRAGKIVRYISQPVVGGFVTGICVEIILMQIPKLYGGDTGTGELFHLLRHIVTSAMSSFNLLSLILAVCSIAVIQLWKKKWPRFPMSVAVMVAGVLLTVLFHVDRYGVRLLPAAQPGLPKLMLPGLGGFGFADLAVSALTIAVVITSETLLASGGFAREDGYRLDNQKEIRAYALANLVAAFTGCCPVNGSISRTGIVRQFGCGSQWMSISAFFVMGIILLLCTGFIQYLPVPVLVSIVVCALYGACEFDLGRKLYKTSKNEFYIYLAALFGVLIFGTVYGVAIGVILVGCCPGGTASNVITYLAKGDLALSVGMTGVSTILAPLLTPVLTWALAGHSVHVNVFGMLLSILWVVILPIVIGLIIKSLWPKFTDKAVDYLPAFSSVAIAFIVAIIIAANADKLLAGGMIIVLVVMLHNICGLGLGYFIGRLLRLSEPKKRAISIEVGMQNSGLASSLATLHFAAYPLATIPGAIFSVWHNISGAIVAYIFRK